MHTDPTPYILAATVISFSLGFMACALVAARRIKEADRAAWREARSHFSRLYSKI